MLSRQDSGFCTTTTMPSVLVETGFITNPLKKNILTQKKDRIILHLQFSGHAEII